MSYCFKHIAQLAATCFTLFPLFVYLSLLSNVNDKQLGKSLACCVFCRNTSTPNMLVSLQN